MYSFIRGLLIGAVLGAIWLVWDATRNPLLLTSQHGSHHRSEIARKVRLAGSRREQGNR